MVRRELLVTLLAYNLVRTTAAAAALLYKRRPRQISFTGTCQYILASWTDMVRGRIPPDRLSAHCLALLSQIATCEVGDPPDASNPASSDAADTTTSSCNNPDTSRRNNSNPVTLKRETSYGHDSAIPT